MYPSGNTVTATRVGSGSVTITATVNACGTTKSVASAPILIGTIDETKLRLNHQTACAGYPIEFGAEYESLAYCTLLQAGVTDVQWDVASPYPYQIEENYSPLGCLDVTNSGRMINFSQQYSSYTAQVRIRVQNSCGWSDWSPYFSIPVQDCDGGWGFVASPNPAKSSVNITLNEQTVKNRKAVTIREVQLTDKLGNINKQLKYGAGNKRVSIDISGLKPDVYIIHVFNGKEWKTQTIIKQ